MLSKADVERTIIQEIQHHGAEEKLASQDKPSHIFVKKLKDIIAAYNQKQPQDGSLFTDGDLVAILQQKTPFLIDPLLEMLNSEEEAKQFIVDVCCSSLSFADEVNIGAKVQTKFGWQDNVILAIRSRVLTSFLLANAYGFLPLQLQMLHRDAQLPPEEIKAMFDLLERNYVYSVNEQFLADLDSSSINKMMQPFLDEGHWAQAKLLFESWKECNSKAELEQFSGHKRTLSS